VNPTSCYPVVRIQCAASRRWHGAGVGRVARPEGWWLVGRRAAPPVIGHRRPGRKWTARGRRAAPRVIGRHRPGRKAGGSPAAPASTDPRQPGPRGTGRYGHSLHRGGRGHRWTGLAILGAAVVGSWFRFSGTRAWRHVSTAPTASQTMCPPLQSATDPAPRHSSRRGGSPCRPCPDRHGAARLTRMETTRARRGSTQSPGSSAAGSRSQRRSAPPPQREETPRPSTCRQARTHKAPPAINHSAAPGHTRPRGFANSAIASAPLKSPTRRGYCLAAGDACCTT
jgi:hypothetical protein